MYYFVYGPLLCYVELRNNGLLNYFDSKWSQISRPATFDYENPQKYTNSEEILDIYSEKIMTLHTTPYYVQQSKED